MRCIVARAPQSKMELNMEKSQFSQLKRESTLQLLGLSLVTLGIYPAYYVKIQTQKIDGFAHAMTQIGRALPDLLLWFSCLSAVLLIATWGQPENIYLQLVSSVLNLTINIMYVVWAYKARNRVNAAFNSKEGDSTWFSGVWTLFLAVIYFNFKVNSINEGLQDPERFSVDA
jgi:hypothetical protein